MAAPAASGPSAPASWGDYVGLTKPWITLLIVAVAVAGYFVALPATVNVSRLGLLVLLGGLASAGAAALNHYFDRDLDSRMRRTRERPLPAARIVPPGRVLVLGIGLSVLGIGLSTVLLNPLTGLSILLGTLTYVGVYTLWLKRRTSWNIVIGGFAGSAPALAGSAAAVGYWTPAALGLALLVFLWTPPHFWSLALLLREDFEKAGLPMLPRMEDPGYSGKVTAISTALLVPATLALIAFGTIAWVAGVALLAAAGLFLAVSVPLWWNPERRVARVGFIVSGPYLLAVVAAVIVNWGLLRAGFGAGL